MADSVSRLVLCAGDAELMKLRTNKTTLNVVERLLSVISPLRIVGSL